MTKIITVAHQKGGVGKSTLALNLALCFQEQLKVALVDSDLQGSIHHIKEEFPGISVIGIEQIAEISTLDFDLIIIDTPPYLSSRLNELFNQSDFVLVPTKAGFFDVMAIRSTLALIKFSEAKNHKLKAGIVLNMLKPRSGITAEVTDLLITLGTPLLNTKIFDRVSLARSSMTAGILKSSDQKAIDEITFLAEEIILAISE